MDFMLKPVEYSCRVLRRAITSHLGFRKVILTDMREVDWNDNPEMSSKETGLSPERGVGAGSQDREDVSWRDEEGAGTDPSDVAPVGGQAEVRMSSCFAQFVR